MMAEILVTSRKGRKHMMYRASSAAYFEVAFWYDFPACLQTPMQWSVDRLNNGEQFVFKFHLDDGKHVRLSNDQQTITLPDDVSFPQHGEVSV